MNIFLPIFQLLCGILILIFGVFKMLTTGMEIHWIIIAMFGFTFAFYGITSFIIPKQKYNPNNKGKNNRAKSVKKQGKKR